jgi:hypothetical protein
MQDVSVCPTDTARLNCDHDLVGAWLRVRHLFDGNVPRLTYDYSPHRLCSLLVDAALGGLCRSYRQQGGSTRGRFVLARDPETSYPGSLPSSDRFAPQPPTAADNRIDSTANADQSVNAILNTRKCGVESVPPDERVGGDRKVIGRSQAVKLVPA